MPEMLKINDGGTMPKRTQAEEATNDLARFMDDWVAWRDTNYVDAEGKKGNYLKFANVFRREGQACTRCGTEIIKTRVAGRGTHVCLSCQVEIE